jgi:hypothetical protein
MKYRVHVYAIVRIPFEIEAESQLEALEKADEFDLAEELAKGFRGEYADDIEGYMVDELDVDGDFLIGNSRSYDKHYNERPMWSHL